MNRALPYVNLLGVFALAALCVVQWRANRRVNLEAAALEKTLLKQAATLAEQDRTLKGQAADLDGFREQLTRTADLLRDVEAKAAAAGHEIRQLAAEREQLKASVTNWSKAVAARDEQLKAANDQLQKLVGDRNGAVAKFNELAEKYNAVVKDLNDARARLAASPPAAR